MGPAFHLPSLTLLAISLACHAVLAQPIYIPCSMSEAVNAATAHVEEGQADAILIEIFTDDTAPDDRVLGIDLAARTAGRWELKFYSPSRRKELRCWIAKADSVSIVEEGSAPGDPQPPLDLSQPYVDPALFLEHMEADTTYQHFRAAHPLAQPTDMHLLMREGRQYWVIYFDEANTYDLTCMMTTDDGVVRSNVTTFASTPSAADTRAHPSLLIACNGRPGEPLTIMLTLPPGRRAADATLGLYDLRGARVLDLSPRLAADRARVVIEPWEIPAGAYFCRAAVDGWSGSAMVVVTH
jgi:hypothetical protein